MGVSTAPEIKNYGIAFIVDSTGVGDLVNLRKKIDELRDLVEVPPASYELPEEAIVLKNNPDPAYRITLLYAIDVNAPQAIVDRIYTDEYYLPGTNFLEFGEQGYTRQEIERRAKLRLSEMGITHFLIVDKNTDLTGNLVARFNLLGGS